MGSTKPLQLGTLGLSLIDGGHVVGGGRSGSLRFNWMLLSGV